MVSGCAVVALALYRLVRVCSMSSVQHEKRKGSGGQGEGLSV